jgi:hypothetical protein
MNAGMNRKKAGLRLFASLALHCRTIILPNFMRETVKEDVDFSHSKIKVRIAPMVERASKRPKKRDFALLY